MKDSLPKGNHKATKGKLLPPSTGARAHSTVKTGHLEGAAGPREHFLLNGFNRQLPSHSLS